MIIKNTISVQNHINASGSINIDDIRGFMFEQFENWREAPAIVDWLLARDLIRTDGKDENGKTLYY